MQHSHPRHQKTTSNLLRINLKGTILFHQWMTTRGSYVHKHTLKFWGASSKFYFFPFLKMLMVSDKAIHKAFRIHKTLTVDVQWYTGLNRWLPFKGLRVWFPSLPGTFVLQQDILSTLLLSTQVYKWVPGRMRTLFVAWCGMCAPLKWRLARMLPRELMRCTMGAELMLNPVTRGNNTL